jgi:hypothetical protein
MPKGINPNDVVEAALKLLNANKSKVTGLADNAANVVDDIAGAGKGLAAAAAKALKGSKSPKPKAPTAPKNPPKSKPLSQKELTTMKADDKYLRSEGRRLEKEATDNGINYMSDEEVAILQLYKNSKAANKAPKGPKPKSPKSGSADRMERAAAKEAKSEANRAAHAQQREAYNKMKAIEREERKASNRANWAKTLEEKYGGNVSAAAKGTSKASKRSKKDAK